MIKAWRCELTALSHVFNLYFVACIDTIQVYQPSFPNQSISAEADLVLHPPVSSPDLESGIDPADPHSITRLHVDFLGREEILLATCDDGDVIGYRVPEIHRAIGCRRHSSDGEDEPADEGRVRVFLHRNVGGSAWGLAIHREARLIAISANTHSVTVLAYALASTSASDSDDSLNTESAFTSSEEEGDFPHPRRRDHVITLTAQTNIPAVSFDNSGLDPSGRWLYSSSIDGANHLWDLHQPDVPARILELGHCVSVKDPTTVPTPCRCRNRESVPHAAWAALFIDPRSCHQCTSFKEALGPGFGPDGPTQIAPCFWDNTELKPRFTTRQSGPFPGFLGQNDDSSSDGSDDMPLSDTEEEEEEEEEEDQAHATAQLTGQLLHQPSPESASGTHEAEDVPGSNNEHAQGGEGETHPPPDEPLFVPEVPAPPHVVLATWLNDDNEGEDGDDESDDMSQLSDAPDDLLQLIEAETAAGLPPLPRPTPTAPIKLPYCELSTSESFRDQVSTKPSSPQSHPWKPPADENQHMLVLPLSNAGGF